MAGFTRPIGRAFRPNRAESRGALPWDHSKTATGSPMTDARGSNPSPGSLEA